MILLISENSNHRDKSHDNEGKIANIAIPETPIRFQEENTNERLNKKNDATWNVSLSLIERLKHRKRITNADLDQNHRHRSHGIHIVVGQYAGKSLPWLRNQFNLTRDLLDSNNYSPIPDFGENGEPVLIPKSLRAKAKRLFQINQFNLMASDLISLNRSLPDVRKKSCLNKRYDVERLPSTSIIIVFHNEAWSTLVRTVHSVIIRSPRTLIKEIILVDDASQRSFLQKSLDDYMLRLSSETEIEIKILRSKKRIGLIKARLIGANHSSGEILTFLDAHCETTEGWLEPLLNRIHQSPKSAVCPIIDIISDQNFAYIQSFQAHWGAMNWALNFRWFSIGRKELRQTFSVGNRAKRSSLETFRTPIMAGGLFSIRRDFFYDIGTYDSHLEVWGGENIEMSLRIWQCGGRIEIVTCSHVGHIFRNSSPYSFGKKEVADVLYSNLVRVAEVWLDEWKHLFYKLNPIAQKLLRDNKDEILVSIDERHQLRNRLRCHSFEWYLTNIWPENFFPNKNQSFGQIRNAFTKDCLQRPSNGPNPIGKVKMAQCSIELYGPQAFVISKPEQIDSIRTDESVCLDVSSRKPSTPVILIACSQMERQKWQYKIETSQIIHLRSKLCLTLDRTKSQLIIDECSTRNRKQQWEIIEQIWYRS
ncbi:microtubule binding protein YTM1 [Sarcoptes scabiei]|nr:microtubule binding protein YTM1 [Sarcoptes scabiei]